LQIYRAVSQLSLRQANSVKRMAANGNVVLIGRR
jgi:hypothetical protein